MRTRAPASRAIAAALVSTGRAPAPEDRLERRDEPRVVELVAERRRPAREDPLPGGEDLGRLAQGELERGRRRRAATSRPVEHGADGLGQLGRRGRVRRDGVDRALGRARRRGRAGRGPTTSSRCTHETTCLPSPIGPPAKSLKGRIIFSSAPPPSPSTTPMRSCDRRGPRAPRPSWAASSHSSTTSARKPCAGLGALVELLVRAARAVEADRRRADEDARACAWSRPIASTSDPSSVDAALDDACP